MGVNGNKLRVFDWEANPGLVHDKLKPRLAEANRSPRGERPTSWTAENCAEADSVNKAYHAGVQSENLVVGTFSVERSGAGHVVKPVHTCPYCKVTTEGFKVITD